jgi:hypothetical protein
MKRYLLLISILLFIISDAIGQITGDGSYGNPFTGTILNSSHNRTFSGAAVYFNQIEVSGGTLTISAGTNMYGANTGAIIIISNTGILNAVGSSGSGVITFTAENDGDAVPEANEAWRNISFDGGTGASVIDYALIERGTGDDYGSGGGINIFYANNVTVRNSLVRNCTAAGGGRGGGINISNGDYNTIVNTEIMDCQTTTGEGGGLAVGDGNGFYNNILKGLRIHGNRGSQGGGVYLDIAVPFDSCFVYNNTCDLSGSAGMYLSRAAIISNSSFYDNYSGVNYLGAGPGTGIWVNAAGAFIRNCLVYDNTTGVYINLSSDIINSTIVNNGTGVIPAATTIMLNTILWGNTSDQYTGTSVSFGNCAIQGGIVGGTDGGGNLNLNATNSDPAGPNFVNSASDFHIGSWNNPIYNAGASSYGGLSATTTDYDNRTRISTVDIGAYEFIYYHWTGSVSADPSVSGNWLGSLATIPSDFSATQIIIPNGASNYPSFSSLTLSSGSRAVVEPAAHLTVTGATAVGSGCTFTLQSGSSGSANFITGSSVSGSFNVELYLAGSTDPVYNWHYVTPPVNGHSKTALTTGISNSNNLLNYLETDVTSADRMLGWQWHDGYEGDTQFDNLYTNQGYNVLLRNLSSRNATFTGTILAGQDITFTNSDLSCGTVDTASNGWHLLGNPFTAGIDVESFTFGSNIEPTVYYTSGNNFATWNTFTHQGTGFGTRYIPGMQGFFVHATDGSNKTLTIPASGRLYSSATIFKSAKISPEYPMLKLNVTDGADYTDEALIYFFDDARFSFDGKYDAYKLLSENPVCPQIYTSLSSVKYSMNGIPLPEQKTEIPLNIRTGESKNYTINVRNLDNLDNYTVTLVHGETKINLKSNPAYTFFAAKGTVSNMSVIFENSLTAITTPEKNNSECWYSNGSVRIKAGGTGFEANTTVMICDMNGRTVLLKKNVDLGSGEIAEIPVNLPRGIYVVSAMNGSNKMVKKIVIAK